MANVDELLAGIREQANKSLKITGPTAIAGTARVQGSKNAANKLVAVTVGLPGKYEIKNFPFILDPLELLSIVEMLGGTVEIKANNTVFIDTTHVENKAIPYELTKTTTGAFGFAGALLGRFGQVTIGKPGGDDIGPRPIDFHVDVFRALGAEVNETVDTLEAKLSSTPEHKQCKLRMPSTGAAVNYVIATAASHGVADLENAPIDDGDMDAMYELLRSCGVRVEVQASHVHINATNVQPSGQTINFTCSPDRNDAFTWLAYGAMSKAGLRVTGLSLKDVEQGIRVLKLLNVQISDDGENGLLIKAPADGATIPANATIIAGLAKEFHSDWAPLLEVVLTTMHGRYQIIDTLFSNRVRQAELLKEMGANVKISGGQPPKDVKLHFASDPETARYIIDIDGPAKLAPITADVGYDVRACAAMIMAASQANGVSQLSSMQALCRGYENIIERLRAIGVDMVVGL